MWKVYLVSLWSEVEARHGGESGDWLGQTCQERNFHWSGR